MIKEIQKDLRYTHRGYDLQLSINDKDISIEVEVSDSERDGRDLDYKFLSRPLGGLTDEEQDELYNYIIENY